MEVINYFAVPGIKRSLVSLKPNAGTAKDVAESITTTICQFMGINKEELYKKKARREVVVCRYIIWNLISRQVDRKEMSLSKIGKLFGFDHSTVTYGLAEIKDNIDLKSINKIFI